MTETAAILEKLLPILLLMLTGFVFRQTGFVTQQVMIVLPFKVRLRPFAPPYFLIRYLHYYGPADYPCVIFLALPFRCRPSPITT